MNVKVIRYRIEDKSDFTRYIFDFILNTIGLVGKETKGKNIDIYYGNKQTPLNYGMIIKKNKSDIVWEELIKGDITIDDINKIIPFDIVNAIGFFLTDEGNKYSPESCDKHDRLIFNKSFQYKLNIANFPIVNLYIAFLKSLFERNFSLAGFPMWPRGRKCAIGLTHDVDNPDKYAELKGPFFNKNADFKNNLFISLKKIRAAIKRLLDRNPDDFWLFKEIMDAEEKFGFKSTFFFAAMNRFGDWGSYYDVSYNIESPKFIKMFQEITSRGFEIGLHISYNAYLDSNRFFIERQKLTKVLGFEVKGLRHHYWHMGRNIEKTLEIHEKARFKCDSSIAFNEELGFRMNIAFPYYPWSEASSRPLKVIQLPVSCMDGNLFYRPIEVNDAVEKFKSHIGTIKQTGGLGVIDWHVRTSYPKNKKYWNWGEAYLEILKYLANDSEIWATNLSEITSWLKKREEILSLKVRR